MTKNKTLVGYYQLRGHVKTFRSLCVVFFLFLTILAAKCAFSQNAIGFAIGAALSLIPLFGLHLATKNLRAIEYEIAIAKKFIEAMERDYGRRTD